MGTSVLDIPDLSVVTDQETAPALPFHVIIYNDEHHTFKEVIHQLQKAVGISVEAAFEIAMEVHTKGRAICFTGTLSRCERVAAILREIALTVEIEQAAE
jgi:ATP-dependent Clp protease adapter protein ClpS